MTTTTTTPRNEDHALGWCCTDCLFLLANGETPVDWTEEKTAEWLAEIDRRTSADKGGYVTLGMMAEQHEDDCPNIDHETMTWLGTSDCSCEQQEFSWSQCDTCGSTLGGAREAVTFWWPVEAADEVTAPDHRLTVDQPR